MYDSTTEYKLLNQKLNSNNDDKKGGPSGGNGSAPKPLDEMEELRRKLDNL